MILSHKHAFIFIKGVKVAGTSVEIALSQICGPEDIITPISPADERYRLSTAGRPRNYSRDSTLEVAYCRAVERGPIGTVKLPKSPFYNHMSLTEVLDLNPVAGNYRLLFVERSPYEKVISFANWSEHRRAYDQGGSLPSSSIKLERAVDRLIDEETIGTVRNIDRYRDASGHLPGSGWRYESLASQLRAFFEQLGETSVELVHAKRGLHASKLAIASALRRDQIDFINQKFADEFATFGYTMI